MLVMLTRGTCDVDHINIFIGDEILELGIGRNRSGRVLREAGSECLRPFAGRRREDGGERVLNIAHFTGGGINENILDELGRHVSLLVYISITPPWRADGLAVPHTAHRSVNAIWYDQKR
jgi:hypothetical protein